MVLLDLLGFARGEILQSGVAAGMDLAQRSRPWETDDIPASPVPVSAVDRIGVKTLPCVCYQQGEEVQVDLRRRLLKSRSAWLRFAQRFARSPRGCCAGARFLDLLEDFILLRGEKIDELDTETGARPLIKVGDTFEVAAPHDLDAPHPGFGRSAFERLEAGAVRLGEDKTDTGQIAVEEVDAARFARTGRVVGRDDAGHRGFDSGPLMGVEERIRHDGTSNCV